MVAVDTNLLVYAHRQEMRQHRRSLSAIERAADLGRWGISLPCLAEFAFAVSRPQIDGRPSTPREIEQFFHGLFEAGAEVLLPSSSFPSRLLEELVRHRVSGKRVFDLQIALIARENGVTEFWTHDTDFIRIPGLRVVDPL